MLIAMVLCAGCGAAGVGQFNAASDTGGIKGRFVTSAPQIGQLRLLQLDGSSFSGIVRGLDGDSTVVGEEERHGPSKLKLVIDPSEFVHIDVQPDGTLSVGSASSSYTMVPIGDAT
jgi:hypothetical protein